VTTSILPQPSPEEAELNLKLAELERLETEIVERELELINLQGRLERTERKYIQTVGNRLVRLDRLRADLAALIAKHKPDDSEGQAKAEEYERQWKAATDEAARSNGDDPQNATDEASEAALSIETPEAAGELKSLFRALVKRWHPDLANDAAEKARRHALMIEVNRLYKARDAAGLRRLLEDETHHPEAISGEGVTARLIRAIRQIAALRIRLQQIKADLMQLREGDLCHLADTLDQAVSPQSVLDQITEDLDAQFEQMTDGLQDILDAS
jgi:hypothetical protein